MDQVSKVQQLERLNLNLAALGFQHKPTEFSDTLRYKTCCSKALFVWIISYFQTQTMAFINNLPSLSISNTLMASCGVRFRNSLAGKVCRRWRWWLATFNGVFRKKGFRKGELTTCGAVILTHALFLSSALDKIISHFLLYITQPRSLFTAVWPRWQIYLTLNFVFPLRDLCTCCLQCSDLFESNLHLWKSPHLLLLLPLWLRPSPGLLKRPVSSGIGGYARARWSWESSQKRCANSLLTLKLNSLFKTLSACTA